MPMRMPMRMLLTLMFLASACAGACTAPEPPLAEKYLHSGQLALGEQALEKALAANPNDGQAQFGLGVIRLVRGVERLGQALHEYGLKPENSGIPFLRLPLAKNPDPAPITYYAFRRVLDDFHRDLALAEATLKAVNDDQVKLPLRLAGVRLDLDGDGQATDKLMDVLKRIMPGQDFGFLGNNPEFLICFDRGDVAWMRAYCCLLMGMLDLYLAYDGEELFDLTAGDLFARPKKPFTGDAAERNRRFGKLLDTIVLKEPARLGRFRKRIVQVAQLNREAWRHIRAETDNDHEWLPNPKQVGVLGLPVRDEMIDGWLAMLAEAEALFEGRRSGTRSFGLGKEDKGLNLKVLLDDPPPQFDRGFPNNLPDKYWSSEKEVDMRAILSVARLFGDASAVGYMAWFN